MACWLTLFDLSKVADLAMPWFMFMMGVSLTFSFNSMVKKGWSKVAMIKKIGLRCVKLMALGSEKSSINPSCNSLKKMRGYRTS